MNMLDYGTLLADVNDGLWFPKQASTYAAEVDSTYAMILWISVFFFVAIIAFMTYFAIAYRKKKGGKATSRTTHNNILEITWSVVPSFLLVVMFVRGSWGFLDMQTPPEGAVQVDVTARTWSWQMNYGGAAFNPELHVVVNQPTKLVMRSDDYIHSFFVPAFRIKRDVVPGRYNVTWFEATTVSERVSDERLEEALRVTKEDGGVFDYNRWQFTEDGYEFFDVYCAEYCGDDHSEMQTRLVVHETQEDLDAWIEKIKVRDPGTPMHEHGQRLYNERGCAGCHTIDGRDGTGPTFLNRYGAERPLADGTSVAVDEQYIRESILEPRAKIAAGFSPVMPSYKGQLTDDDIQSLIAFLRTISTHAPSQGSAAGEAGAEGTVAEITTGDNTTTGADAASDTGATDD